MHHRSPHTPLAAQASLDPGPTAAQPLLGGDQHPFRLGPKLAETRITLRSRPSTPCPAPIGTSTRTSADQARHFPRRHAAGAMSLLIMNPRESLGTPRSFRGRRTRGPRRRSDPGVPAHRAVSAPRVRHAALRRARVGAQTDGPEVRRHGDDESDVVLDDVELTVRTAPLIPLGYLVTRCNERDEVERRRLSACTAD